MNRRNFVKRSGLGIGGLLFGASLNLGILMKELLKDVPKAPPPPKVGTWKVMGTFEMEYTYWLYNNGKEVSIEEITEKQSKKFEQIDSVVNKDGTKITKLYYHPDIKRKMNQRAHV